MKNHIKCKNHPTQNQRKTTNGCNMRKFYDVVNITVNVQKKYGLN